jgi:hypothetical protein
MPKSKREQIVLKWHPKWGLWDSKLKLHNGEELLGWAKRGIDFVVLDAETGQDVTRLFLMHYKKDGQLEDPIGGASQRK